MSPVYLIGGAPCAGKSTVAKALAEELSQSWVSTDTLRLEFQNNLARDQRHHYPWIFSSVEVTAEKFWESRTPADAMQVEIEQGREFWPKLQTVIQAGAYPIIEGVSIIPECLHQDLELNSFRAVFLVDTNRARVSESIYRRGLWAEPETYADWIKPLELEWVMLHNEWYRNECQKYDLPCIEVGDRSTLLPRVRQALAE